MTTENVTLARWIHQRVLAAERQKEVGEKEIWKVN